MTEINISEKQLESTPASVPVFGYELIREVLLPSILGKDTAGILYWAGKDIARKFPLKNLDEIIDFFTKAGWGLLTIKNENKKEIDIELSSPIISERLKQKSDCHFQLEAGFLAQQLQYQKEVIAEAYEHPKKKSGKVLFTIKWDKKDPV